MSLQLLRRRTIRRPRVLALVDLIQDIDVILPVLVALRDNGGFALRVVVSAWLRRESPRTESLLRQRRLAFSYLPRGRIIDGSAPTLGRVDALLTASESTHPAHRAGHALARRANALGLRTYTLQHGLEALGLLGWEAMEAGFASGAVFCWFPRELTPPALPAETRGKLVHVGRPEPLGGWGMKAPPTYDLAVYENLHWERYGDADRRGFIAGLRAVLQGWPAARVMLHPHPAGGWADALRHEFAQFSGLTLVEAKESRRVSASTAQSPALAARVITTPSTIALDAALAGRPAALAIDGGSIYTPLEVLRRPGDWLAFAQSDKAMAGMLDDFKRRVLVGGDATGRIVEQLRRDLGVQSEE